MEWDIEIEIMDVAPTINKAYYFIQMKHSRRTIKVKTTQSKKWFETVFNALCDKYPLIEKMILLGEVKYPSGYVEVRIDLYFTDRRRHDCDNFQKLTNDALTGKLWKDDSQIKKITTCKYEGVSERKTIIKVRGYGDNQISEEDKRDIGLSEEEKRLLRQIIHS